MPKKPKPPQQKGMGIGMFKTRQEAADVAMSLGDFNWWLENKFPHGVQLIRGYKDD